MQVSISDFRKDAGDYFVKFKAEVDGAGSFDTEAMVSAAEAKDRDNDEITAIAWAKVRTTVEYNAAQLESPPDSGTVPDMIGKPYRPAPSFVNSIQIFGNTSVHASADVPAVVQYAAILSNQYGDVMQGARPVWAVSPAVAGVSIDETGKLTINRPDWSAVASVEIVATSGDVEARQTVEINPPLVTAEMKAKMAALEAEAASLRARDATMMDDNIFILETLIDAGLI